MGKNCFLSRCESPARTRGLCSKHYQRLRVNGATELRPRVVRFCSVDGCDSKMYALDFCNKHWQRFKKHGDPLGGGRRYDTPEEAIKAQAKKVSNCLLWTGYVNDDGYGVFSARKKRTSVHRFVWEKKRGTIPEGMEIDHICLQRNCINLEHLRLASNAENKRNRNGARVDSSTGVRNVTPHGRTWQVSLRKNKVYYYLGTYETIEEAAVVAEQGREKLFGAFAGKG